MRETAQRNTIKRMETLKSSHLSELEGVLNGQSPNKFDVLKKQEGPTGEAAFVKAEKPTDISKDLASISVKTDEVRFVAEPVQQKAGMAEIPAAEIRPEQKKRTFPDTHPLIQYVDSLIGKGKQIKALRQWDLVDPISKSKFENALNTYFDLRRINYAEKEKMLELFDTDADITQPQESQEPNFTPNQTLIDFIDKHLMGLDEETDATLRNVREDLHDPEKEVEAIEILKRAGLISGNEKTEEDYGPGILFAAAAHAEKSEKENLIPSSIPPKDFDDFVKTGQVSPEILTHIAGKIVTGEEMADEERAIYSEHSAQIEDLLKQERMREENTPQKTEEIEVENMDAVLAEARSEYATQLIAWKNANRQKKNKFAKVMADLGVYDKKPPESEIPLELVGAEKAYVEAKKKKYFSKEGHAKNYSVLEDEEANEFVFNAALLNEVEGEYQNLQKKITESLPPSEWKKLKKGLELWGKVPMPVRVAASTAVLGGVALATGTLVMGGAAAFGGYKVTRGIAGGIASKTTGRLVDGIFKKGNERMKGKIFEKYGTNITEENFEKKERELMEAMDKEENAMKRQRLYKAGAMVAAGGLTSAGAGIGLHSLHHVDIPVGGGGHAPDTIPKTGTVIPDHGPKTSPMSADSVQGTKVSVQQPDIVPATPKISENLPEMKVELSSRGFIDDFEHLKTKLVEQYGDTDHVPVQYEHFIKTPSTKLAQEFGFYDPERNLSGMGMQGENLTLDAHGNLVYHHLDGTDHVMMSGDTGDIEEKFSGKMFAPKSEEVIGADDPANSMEHGGFTPEQVQAEVDSLHTPDLPIPDHTPDVISSTTHNLTESAPLPDAEHIISPHVPEVHPDSIHQASILDNLKGKDYKALFLDDANHTQIAHELPFGTNGASGMEKILALDDKFQTGTEFAPIRKLFASALTEYLQNKNLGTYVFPVNFDGGVVHVIQGVPGNSTGIEVLLNGKEIAKGVMTADGPHVEMLKGLKGGFLIPDTVYEKAFKHVSQIIKHLPPIK